MHGSVCRNKFPCRYVRRRGCSSSLTVFRGAVWSRFISRNFLLGEKGHRPFFISLKIFVYLRAHNTQTLSSTHVVSKLWLRRAYEECRSPDFNPFCRLYALANKMLSSNLLLVGGYTSCWLCLSSSRLLQSD